MPFGGVIVDTSSNQKEVMVAEHNSTVAMYASPMTAAVNSSKTNKVSFALKT